MMGWPWAVWFRPSDNYCNKSSWWWLCNKGQSWFHSKTSWVFSHCLVFRQQQGNGAAYCCSYSSPHGLSPALCSHIPVTGRCLSVPVPWWHFFGCFQACWKWQDQQREQLAGSTGNAVPAQDPRCSPGKFTVRWHQQFHLNSTGILHWKQPVN